MGTTLEQLARLVDGQLHGDGSCEISGAAILRDVQRGQITFVDNPTLADKVGESQASAVLSPPDVIPSGVSYIRVDNVHEAFAQVVSHFCPPRPKSAPGISSQAVISPTASIGEGVAIHANAVIGDEVAIGDGCIVHPGVQVMAGCRIREQVTLFPNVVLHENTIVGARCVIHANVVIGAYGFGYNFADGRHQLSAQLGYVEIGDDVDIGACTTVDRGTYGPTVIGEGTKIDNQVQIAHNCRIGRHNIICSQVGIAGSATTGDYVVLAGQVGVRDHIHIGTGAKVGAKGGVVSSIPDGETYIGIPCTPERHQKRVLAAIQRLPEIKQQVKAMQRQLKELEHLADPLPAAKAG